MDYTFRFPFKEMFSQSALWTQQAALRIVDMKIFYRYCDTLHSSSKEQLHPEKDVGVQWCWEGR